MREKSSQKSRISKYGQIQSARKGCPSERLQRRLNKFKIDMGSSL